MIISIEDIFKSFNGNYILENINCKIEDNDKIGLIGVNGAGKSTFLNIICNNEKHDSGNLFKNKNKTIAILKQDSGLNENNTVYDELRLSFLELLNIEQELKELTEKLSNEKIINQQELYKKISKEYSEKNDYFEQKEGYLIDVKINTISNGMGFGEFDIKTNLIKNLSGGEKTRLAMAKLLLNQPDLLILDEPTNHLDFKTLIWLEDYLCKYPKALLIVSHDRYFLDKVTNLTWEIENKNLICYTGNYSKYLILKQQNLEIQTKEYEAQQKEIAKMQDFVDRNIARASTSKMAKSRQKSIEKMDIIDKPIVNNKSAKLKFDFNIETGKNVLTIDDLSISVGQNQDRKKLINNFSCEIFKQDKIGIIGVNGVGKSTFLKAIQNLIEVDNGDILWGQNVKISYYEQHAKIIDKNNRVIDELWNRYRNKTELEIRNALGKVLFSGDDIYKTVGNLSGGEKARLMFAVISFENSNVLILDEPTNHLDLRTKEILENALYEFEGTIIFVSHDRYFLNKVSNKIIEFEKDKYNIFNGKFNYYLEQKQNNNIDITPERKPVPEKSGSSYKSKEQKRQEALLRVKIKELEKLIEQTENNILILEQDITDPKVYEDYKLMEEKCKELELQRKLHDDYFNEYCELT